MGMPNSAGHYLDLVSAILGCTLLPAGLIASFIVPQFEFDRPSRTEASRHDCPMYAASRFLVLFGAACLTVVVLTHVAETFGIFPGMGWACRTAPAIKVFWRE